MKKHIIFVILMSLFAPAATVHTFPCPKQKYKLRMERKARLEDPEYEYIYYNKVKNATLGALCLPFGLIMTLDGFFNPHLKALETALFSACGPLLTMAGIKLLDNAFHSGPAVIINAAGIITNEQGLTLWEEVNKGTLSYDNNTMVLELDDESSILIQCGVLNTTLDKFLLKMNRYKRLRFFGDTFTIIHD